MFLIITVKDTNLEDLFTDSISVFTTVSFWTMNIKKVMAVCMELSRRRGPLAFVFKPKILKLGSIYCSVRKWKLALKRSRRRVIRPLLLSPPPGIWQLKCSRPREFAIHEKKKANSRRLARGGGWAQVELTYTLSLNEMFSKIIPVNVVRQFTHWQSWKTQLKVQHLWIVEVHSNLILLLKSYDH